MDKEIFKKVTTKFFYHWWNEEGNNTAEGFDKWWEDKGRELVKNCSIPDVSDQRELLISFMKFRDQIYWGENGYTENEEIIDLWLKRNQ